MIIHRCLGCGNHVREENSLPVINTKTNEIIGRVHKRPNEAPTTFKHPCHAVVQRINDAQIGSQSALKQQSAH